MPVLSASNSQQPHPVETPDAATTAAAPSTSIDSRAITPSEHSTTPTGSRRRWPWVLASLGATGAVAVGAVVAFRGDDSASDPAQATAINTVTAATRDLIEFTDLDGRMVYADITSVTAAADGLVTATTTDGAIVERGDALYAVNASAVTVFYGDVPLYRPLGDGAVGDDVLLVEANLASLGFHSVVDDEGVIIDSGFAVDGIYDAATADAVVRWQSEAGLPETGIVNESDVIVVAGSSVVSNVSVDVGSRLTPGAPVAELNTLSTTNASYIAHTGDIDVFVTAGQTLATGDLVYAVDDIPITAVVSTTQITRDIESGVDPGDDVTAIEEMLAALGYDAGGDLDVDDEFDDATAQAITDWQDDLQNIFEAIDVDGSVSAGDVIVYAPDTVVGTLTVPDGGDVASGTELWSTESGTATRIVETSIAAADQDDLVEGDTVEIEFPDGEIVTGTVTQVATSSTVDPMDPDADPTLAVELSLPTVPESAGDLIEADVTIKLVDALAADATVVPVSALVATGDGAFAVEAVTTNGTTFVTVEPGMFNDGWVEVSGIQPGTQVVVP